MEPPFCSARESGYQSNNASTKATFRLKLGRVLYGGTLITQLQQLRVRAVRHLAATVAQADDGAEPGD
jgi:hypothetical protein